MTLYPTEPKAIITVHPYKEAGWKGWVVAIQDPETNELIQRKFYYKADAVKLTKDVEGKTFDAIMGIYGCKYFEKVKRTPKPNQHSKKDRFSSLRNLTCFSVNPDT